MQRFMLLAVAGLLVVSFGSGCAQTPSTGVVAGPTLQVAPSVPFTGEGGKVYQMGQLYGDVTIVSFVTLKGEACARVSEPILKAAKELKGEGIPIVEVMYPTGDCKTPGTKVSMHERSYLYTCIEDPKAVARTAFGVGDEDKVFLLGEKGKVLKVAAPSDVAALIEEAKTIEHKKDFMYGSDLTF